MDMCKTNSELALKRLDHLHEEKIMGKKFQHEKEMLEANNKFKLLKMEKEKINKAAEEFAEREYETSVVDRDYLHKGFYHGAQWRINSVWHDARKDVPKEFIPILVERDDFTFSVNMVGGNMTSCPLHWVHWAYVIDLLPERKEETE